MAGNPEKDAISGQSTTGHEWDGIKELNTPLPKWWVYVFYATIVWAIGYWVVYPSWPTPSGYAAGMGGYSSRANLEVEMANARAAHADKVQAIASQDLGAIMTNADLRAYAMRGGEVLFKENCAPCHQTGGAGAYGYPTLADDSWIWGGTLDDIQFTITHGIRSSDMSPMSRVSDMPAYGVEGLLSAADIRLVAEYVAGMSQGNVVEGPGQELYLMECAMCHSSDGMDPVSDGNPMLGAPALGDQNWLFIRAEDGDLAGAIARQVHQPVQGVMPAWGGRLSESDIKQLTVYVHTLGGGQ